MSELPNQQAAIKRSELLLQSNYQHILKPWLVCLAAALFFFYDFIQMFMCNVLSDALMRDFGLNPAELSMLPFSFSVANVAFLFPAGIILNRVSVRKTTLLMLSASVIGTFGVAITDDFFFACCFRFLAGIAHAFCFLCCILLAARWFPPRRQALVVGIMVTIAMSGGLVAQSPLAMLSDWVGWRNALLLDTVLGLSILALVWSVVDDYPEDAKPEPKKSQTFEEFKIELKACLSNVQTWLYGLYTGLLNLPIMVLGGLWGVKFFMDVYALDKSEAAYISGMIYLGTILGAPLAGWLSDKWGKRRAPMLWGAVASIVVLALVLYAPLFGVTFSVFQWICLFFVLGVVTSAQVISYPAVHESAPKKLSATAMGLASVLIMGLGALAQKISGIILNNYTLEQSTSFPTEGYHAAFAIISIGFVAALICACLLRETHCRSID